MVQKYGTSDESKCPKYRIENSSQLSEPEQSQPSKRRAAVDQELDDGEDVWLRAASGAVRCCSPFHCLEVAEAGHRRKRCSCKREEGLERQAIWQVAAASFRTRGRGSEVGGPVLVEAEGDAQTLLCIRDSRETIRVQGETQTAEVVLKAMRRAKQRQQSLGEDENEKITSRPDFVAEYTLRLRHLSTFFSLKTRKQPRGSITTLGATISAGTCGLPPRMITPRASARYGEH
ncbi:hypothetical protein K438DRAFT_2117455 [Mycena galopus ATCC 62051]|nr:hypothetical protein K438DRAFT_2117455 [Mycena galopus ATCC 62051]